MSKTFYYMAGLPRSGSTLLANLMAQNPALHVSSTSGILGMIVNVRNFWPKIDEFRAMDPKVSDVRRVATMRGMLEGFYSDTEQSAIIDKSRGWLAHMEMSETILGKKPKVIVTVRDVRDVLASFEKKFRESKGDVEVAQEAANPVEYQSCEGRCNVLLATNNMVGSAIVAIRDAVHRGWRSQMHFVEYDRLCENPRKELAAIYEFLELDGFQHDSNRVEQTVNERDEVWGWKNLHKIRAVVQKQEPQWPKYLPPQVAAKYQQDAYFWRNL